MMTGLKMGRCGFSRILTSQAFRVAYLRLRILRGSFWYVRSTIVSRILFPSERGCFNLCYGRFKNNGNPRMYTYSKHLQTATLLLNS